MFNKPQLHQYPIQLGKKVELTAKTLELCDYSVWGQSNGVI